MKNEKNTLEMEEKKQSRFLSGVEKLGNKIPHPIVMFATLSALIIVLSLVLNLTNVTAIHPSTGDTLSIVNLISFSELMNFMQSFVANFQTFPVLGIVLLMTIATGICESTGFFNVALRMSMKNVKGNAVVFIIALIGVVSNQFGDAAFVVIPTLAGAIFLAMGRHPLAGVFLGYASVGGGYTTALLPSAWDVELTPVAVAAAQTLDPSFDMNPLSGYFFLFVSAILVTILASVVTVRIIEPQLGKWHGEGEELATEVYEPTELERKGIHAVIRNVIIYVVLIVVACIPSNSLMRNPETGSLLINSGLMNSLQFLILFLFYVVGFTYAIAAKKWTSVSDAAEMAGEGIKSMATFVVMAVVIGQFLYFLSRSNIGAVLAINAGNAISKLGLPGWVICVVFLLLVAIINFLIPSGNTKWMLLGPIFVPLMMQLNIHPAFTQAVYRLGDCATNHLTPLFAYFVILLSTAQKYDKKAGVGTLFAAMMPYSIAFFAAYALQVIAWTVFNLPVGIGGQVFLG